MVDQNHIPGELRQDAIQGQEKRTHKIHLIVESGFFLVNDTDNFPGCNLWRGRSFNQFIVPVDEPSHPFTIG